MKSSGGFCRGFTFLWLYAKWLETQPLRRDAEGNPVSRDDETWLRQALGTISSWDGKSPLTTEQEDRFERVTAQIRMLQGLQEDIFFLRQNDFDVIFSDTRGRLCSREYFLDAKFTNIELASTLNELVPEGKPVFISSLDHSMGLFREGNRIFYIDPNRQEGMEEITSGWIPDLAFRGAGYFPYSFHFSFSKGVYLEKKSQPFVIQICGINEEKPENNNKIIYPSHNYFLQKLSWYEKPLPSPLENTELEKAAYHGQLEMLKALLNQPNFAEARTNDSKFLNSSLLISIVAEQVDVTKFLLSSGVNPNFENDKGLFPLGCAFVCYKNLDVMKALVDGGADVNYRNRKGDTSLDLAVSTGSMDATRYGSEGRAVFRRGAD